jgi:cation diffusion facilitator family transporter
MDKLKAASYSIYVNVALSAAKLGVGLLTGSIALIAEFLNSFFDLLASVFAYLGIYKASQPADSSHPYGHEKFENLSALLQVVLIVLTAAGIAWTAIMRLVQPQRIESSELGIAVMACALAVDYFFGNYLLRVSRRERSAALETDAYHFTSDLWSGAAVIAGLACASVGFPQGDSIAALIVAGMMAKVSYELGGKSLGVLLDSGADGGQIKAIAAILAKEPQVKGYHKLRTRHMGSMLVVDMHILVDDRLALSKAHAIANRIEARIARRVPGVKDVTIHVEPFLEEAKKKR